MAKRDYYEVLGVDRSADEDKIKKAYIYFKEKYNIRPIDWLDAD